MESICPKFSSGRVESSNMGRKAGSVVCVIAGAAVAAAGAAAVGTIAAGPVGLVVGPIAVAVILALAGGAAGCAVGAALGDVVDENILGSHRCLSCGHRFGLKRS